MTTTLFILNDPPYGTECSYNGLRLAGAMAGREGESVLEFLMGDAAACTRSGQKTPDGYYNIERMLKIVARKGGEIGVCGTCMDARGTTDEQLIEGAEKSTLETLADWVQRADRTLTFQERF